MSWSTTALSTRASVKKIESEFSSTSFVADTQIDDKIALAKSIIGNSTELYLTVEKKITVDEADGEILLDTIANPSVLALASDYLVASLLLEDISGGDDRSLSFIKSERDYQAYLVQYESAKDRFNLDHDLDGTADTYRDSHVGMLVR